MSSSSSPILAVVPWDLSAHLVRHAVDPLLGSSTFMFNMLLPIASKVYLKTKKLKKKKKKKKENLPLRHACIKF